MSNKNLPDRRYLEMLRGEITKVRCWLGGFSAGRNIPGQIQIGIPGEDSLRQTIIMIDELLANKAIK